MIRCPCCHFLTHPLGYCEEAPAAADLALRELPTILDSYKQTLQLLDRLGLCDEPVISLLVREQQRLRRIMAGDTDR